VSATSGQALLSALAQLLAYPDQRWPAFLAQAQQAAGPGECGESLKRLYLELASKTEQEREEAYVAAFDFDPQCTLEIGWHLFGEDYRRGEFLVRLRGLLRQKGIPEAGHLPDHLSLVLQLLPELSEAEATALFQEGVALAVEKIRQGLVARKSPFAWLLAAIDQALRAHFSLPVGGDYERG
jgi:nitrate reductase delta subunit